MPQRPICRQNRGNVSGVASVTCLVLLTLSYVMVLGEKAEDMENSCIVGVRLGPIFI